MARKDIRLAWIPDLPDYRDHLYSAPREVLGALPTSKDLRPQCPGVYDQEQLGSCTANSVASAIEFDQIRQKLPAWTPSRLFIYWNERALQNTTGSDSGATLREGIKTVNAQGVCPETTWPYVITAFATKPSAPAFAQAKDTRAVSYQRVARDLGQMRGCLASGYPFVFGFTVYDSFMSPEVAKGGQVPMPSPTDSVQGGHAVAAVGYDDASQRFIVRNSWGKSWGLAGYFTMPYAYLIQPNLSNDFWTIRSVS